MNRSREESAALLCLTRLAMFFQFSGRTYTGAQVAEIILAAWHSYESSKQQDGAGMIDTAQLALPKPSAQKTRSIAVVITRDGREICQGNSAGKREYARRRTLAHRLYGGICLHCLHPVSLEEVTAEHLTIRSGGKRTEAQWNLAIAHSACNFSRGSRKIPGLEEQAVALLKTSLGREDYLTPEERVIAEEIVRHLDRERE